MNLPGYDAWKTREPYWDDDPAEIEQWEEERYLDSIGWDPRFGYLDDDWEGWEPDE